ncbi:helix-turn-helix transcriptional regulator [Lysobacter sp. 2RAF19]
MLFEPHRFYRLPEIIDDARNACHGPFPIRRSTWYQGVASGRFPKGVKFGGKLTAWRGRDLNLIGEPPDADEPSTARAVDQRDRASAG